MVNQGRRNSKIYSFLGFGLLLLALTVWWWTIPSGHLADSNPPVRGLWVVRYNLATQAEIDGVIKAAETAGFQGIFAQVCGRAESYYNSDLLPLATGVEPGFDPLAYLLTEAHRRGIQVHAWVNAYTISSLSQIPESPQHVLNRHPEWILVDNNGRSLRNYQKATEDVPAIFLDPGAAGVRGFVAAIVEEILERYPVDGIHLDYIRYPGAQFGYSPSSRQQFQAVYGWDPLKDQLFCGSEWDDWRRAQVTATVAEIKSIVDAQTRAVQYSTAVFFDPAVARESYFQDWPTWIQSDLVDFVVPMVYLEDPIRFALALQKIEDYVDQKRVYPGIGAYKILDRPEALTAQVLRSLEMGFSGVVFFEYRTMAQANLFSRIAQIW